MVHGTAILGFEKQARVQLEARTDGRLKFELLHQEVGDGLTRLPSPSSGDMFLDFEGDPFVGEGGLEYLFRHTPVAMMVVSNMSLGGPLVAQRSGLHSNG